MFFSLQRASRRFQRQMRIFGRDFCGFYGFMLELAHPSWYTECVIARKEGAALNFTQMLSAIVGVLALFLLIYGACVRSRTVALIGVALALADYAITLTLTQLPEISAVSVTVRGQPLAYRDRQIFTARDVLFSSNEDVIDTLNATLYFLDETGGLTPVEMTLDLYEGDTQAGAVVKALLEGTEEKDWLSAIPEGFQVTSVRLEESTCYVDLPTAALPGLPEEADLSLALRALADSLLSLRAVEEVRYLVDGEFASAYGGAAVLEPYLSAA